MVEDGMDEVFAGSPEEFAGSEERALVRSRRVMRGGGRSDGSVYSAV